MVVRTYGSLPYQLSVKNLTRNVLVKTFYFHNYNKQTLAVLQTAVTIYFLSPFCIRYVDDHIYFLLTPDLKLPMPILFFRTVKTHHTNIILI